jgi:predicted phage baseplate assembly protein
VRGSGKLGGLDYVEVYPDGVTLCVHLFGRIPEGLSARNVAVEGGDRIRDVRVLQAQFEKHDDGDTCLRVIVDKKGDFSTYCLCLIEPVEQHTRCTSDSLPAVGLMRMVPVGIDPRYACAPFSFRVDCPSQLDCKPVPCAPAPLPPPPAIDYLARDFSSFRQLLLDRLALTMPQWQERHVPDLGITVVELLAYVADRLSYQLDAIATEAYLGTARRRISVRRHARLLDYRMHDGCNARALVTLELNGQDKLSLSVSDLVFAVPPTTDQPAPRGLIAWKDLQAAAGTVIFEAIDCTATGTVDLYAAHDTIHFYTWRGEQCCLPAGSTRTTLVDRADPLAKLEGELKAPPQRVLHLKAGDLLIFEEIRGGQTGAGPDADARKRWAVRLTRVAPTTDPLDGTPLLEVEWGRDDAVPFALCLSSRTLPDSADAVYVAKGGSITLDIAPDASADQVRPVVTVTTPPVHGKAQVSDAGLVIYQASEDFVGNDSVEVLLTDSDGGSTTRILTYNVAIDVQCVEVEVAVVRGNVLLVDHGSTVFERSDAWVVETDAVGGCCKCDGTAVDVRATARPLTITLSQIEVTHAACACDPGTPASALCVQDPAAAIASIALDMAPSDPVAATVAAFPGTYDWRTAFDLLASAPTDARFVAEIDDDGRAQLRFGDGDCGRAPPAGARFRARYRVGNGATGNVGAEAIAWIALRSGSLDGVTLKPRNPLPAAGGIDPESIDHVKQYAPHAYGRVLERAVTAADYATIAGRDARIQGAKANIAWTGTTFDACISLDVYARDMRDPSVAGDARARLHEARRIGHDVRLVPVRRVPLMVALNVCIEPSYAQSDVVRAVLDSLSDRVLADGSLGLFHPDRWVFGEDVAASRIVAAVQVLDGVAHVELTTFSRADEDDEQARASLIAGVIAIGADEIAQLDNSPDFPERGTLKLTVTGGR